MDADDPEKRITDLEHQLAEQKRGADLPPAQPPQQANAAPETGSDSRKPARIGAWTRIVALLGIFCGVAGVVFLRAPFFSSHPVGTATTATYFLMSGGFFATGLVLLWWSARHK